MNPTYRYPQAFQKGLAKLGFPGNPAPVVAPAPRATRSVSPEESAHITKLLGALLNVEDSAAYLESRASLNGQLRADIGTLRKYGKLANARMMAEFSPEDAAVVDTLNRAGNMLSRLCILLCHCPPEVADEAANAAADVVQAWGNSLTDKQ